MGHRDSSRTIFVMPTRRSSKEAREAWGAMMMTASRVPNSVSYFLDGTDDWLVHDNVRDIAGTDQQHRVIRRLRGDSGFEALQHVHVSDVDRVVFFHDDDAWAGTPDPEGDVSSALLYPRIPVFDRHHAPRCKSLLSTQHVLFGAIRGDIFNTYLDFLRSHPRPCGALDWPLRSVVLANGVARSFSNYQYDYDMGHWVDSSSAEAANDSVLGEGGWTFSDSRALSMLVVMMDSIALLAAHARRTGQPLRVSAVADELAGPPFRGARMRKLLRMTAFVGDAVEPLVRRAGRANVRNLYLSGRFATVDRRTFPALYSFIVESRVQAVSLHHLRDSLIPRFLREFPDEVRPQLEFWQHGIDEAIILRAGRGG